MGDGNQALKKLPSVNDVLEHARVAELVAAYGRDVVKHGAQTAIARARAEVRAGGDLPDIETIVRDTASVVDGICGDSLKPVINATGVILHTNLGRAPLGKTVVEAISRTAVGYSNLEFDLANACRGHRRVHAAEILRFLTGAEDVLVVNNNAAAVMLALRALARGREVIVSRGELIEIGGSFRIPEIMAASGARMVEVGTTNRTRLSDYESAMTPETALLFKAHKSNFAICGFTEEVGAGDLAGLARARGIPMVHDLGSGLLRAAAIAATQEETCVADALREGADVVTFSCDKLLGGPQAGVVAGKTDLLKPMASDPLMRAVRVGKLTLAGVAAACRQYLRDHALRESCPIFTMMSRSLDELGKMASGLASALKDAGVDARVVDSVGHCGGGSAPQGAMESRAVEIPPQSGIGDKKKTFAETLFAALLKGDSPVLGVLREGRLLLDVLTVFEEDIPTIVKEVAENVRRK